MAGPAQGHSTEQGDSWHTAVAKINAGFKNIVKAIEGGAGVVDAPDDVALGKRLTEIEDALAALQIKVDALTTPPAVPAPQPSGGLMGTAEFAVTIGAMPPPAPETAIPVTTASTYIGAGGPATPAT